LVLFPLLPDRLRTATGAAWPGWPAGCRWACACTPETAAGPARSTAAGIFQSQVQQGWPGGGRCRDFFNIFGKKMAILTQIAAN
jgi:hypothetical protein